jgi:DNA-binding transcriptional ArsR family regulator
MQAKNHIPLNDGQIEEAARLFATLSEPSRLRLLQLLMRGPMTVTEIVDATGMKQGNVSKQLGTLYDARLVKRNREGNFIRYAIGDEMIFQLCDLVCHKIQSDALARIASLQGLSRRQKERVRKSGKIVANRFEKPVSSAGPRG